MSGMQTVLTQPEYCSHNGLLKRGWTESAIEKFLIVHDKEAPNPHYRNGFPMKLYLLTRVESAEKGEEYRLFCETNRARRDASSKAVQTKRSKLLRQVAKWEIYIQPQHLHDVMQAAIESYNAIRTDRSADGFQYDPATLGSDREFLCRITVNYLRHRCSPYERKLNEIAGKVGKKEAYILLNQNIYKKISLLHPELKEECDRQLEEKIRNLVANEMYVQIPGVEQAGQTGLNDF